MAKITMTLADGTTKELSARSIDAPVRFTWGYGIVLRQPVTLDGVKMSEGVNNEFGIGTVCQLEDGQTISGRVKIFATDEDAVSVRVFTVDRDVLMLQSVSSNSDNIGAFRGKFGPFEYMVDMHLDIENPMSSVFIVQLSCMGLQLADVHMDAQHPTVSIDASIAKVGVKGELGVNFEQQRIYVSAIVRCVIVEKKYEFDLYHWGNTNVKMLPMVKNMEEGDNGVAKAMQLLQNGNIGGSITVRNSGGYVAKFKVSFTLNGQRVEKESGNFTAGVNKQIEIPAGATDIQVEALAAWFIKSWSSIFTVGFDTPVRKNYEVSGTTLNTKWKEI